MINIARIPITATDLSVIEVLFSLKYLFGQEGVVQDKFKKILSAMSGGEYLFLFDSGISGFFVILEALKESAHEKEVVLPAYTAGSLVVAIRKAGLKPILCDISQDEFNLDSSLLPNIVSKQTLAILGVHMFGMVMEDLKDLKKKFPEVYVVEDCAQGFGSKINGVPVGNLGDVSFFSFNRGKNLSTYGGGCIATNNEELAEKIKQVISGERLTVTKLDEKIIISLKILAVSLVVNPWIYGILYPIICRFKETSPPDDFKIKEYTDLQAGVALSLLKKIEEFSQKRYLNGIRIIEGLKAIGGIVLPKISANTQPAFNRLPVVFRDLKRKKKVEEKLWRAGFETSRMYLRPLHHMFDLGYKKEEFPNAVYFAEHVLTLPTHPMFSEPDLEKIIRAIKTP